MVSWLHPLQANLSFLNSRDFGVIPATYYEGAVVNGLPYVLGDNVVVSPGEDENVWRSMHAKDRTARTAALLIEYGGPRRPTMFQSYQER